MPIYQYACGNCGHAMEALQKMSDAPLTDCPKCGEPALSKQLTAAAFKLKGTGWYETDFKNSNKNTDSKSGSNKSGEAKAGKSESKTGTD